VTVDRSALASETALVEAANAAAPETEFGSDALFAPLEALRVDRIDLSARARALIAAGLAIRTLLMQGIHELRRRVALGDGRWLVLESGIYGTARASSLD
jgi:hypothetical protein